MSPPEGICHAVTHRNVPFTLSLSQFELVEFAQPLAVRLGAACRHDDHPGDEDQRDDRDRGVFRL
jgi:hypothetical protein